MNQKRKSSRRLMLCARTWLVPAILVIVACVHMNQWNNIQRSSWGTGAGFGMFATVDYHGSRFFRCHATTSHGTETKLHIPESIKRGSGMIARAIPSDENLALMIGDLQSQDWYEHRMDDGNQYLSHEPGDSTERVSIVSMRLLIGGLKLDSENKRLVSFAIAEMDSADRVNRNQLVKHN